MRRVDGPFGRAEQAGIPIVDLFEKDVASGDDVLAELIFATRKEILEANDAILYVISGPEPAKTTPMQYGGHFLERDRELLEFANQKGEVWLFVDAGPGAYLDFVSDLPAEVFAWNAVKTGFPLSEMRKLRNGRLCTNEQGADLPLDALELEAAKVG